MGDKIPADKKTELEGAIAEGKAVLENQDADVEALNAPKDKIMEIMQSFAQDLYGQAGPDMAGAAAGAAAGGAGPEAAASEPKQAEGETVDADFEVVDEDKK